jgi:hypothetical protein
MKNGELEKEDIIKIIIEDLVPFLEWSKEDYWHNVGKYYFGIGDGYNWDKEKLKDLDEKELLKIMAICSYAWLKKYEKWYHKAIAYGL